MFTNSFQPNYIKKMHIDYKVSDSNLLSTKKSECIYHLSIFTPDHATSTALDSNDITCLSLLLLGKQLINDTVNEDSSNTNGTSKQLHRIK